MALDFNLLNGDGEIENYKTHLARNIKNNGYKLNTGFAGTAILNTTLSRFSLGDYAYDLLLQRNCPSWLYSVDQGATTIWERWNSYTKESGFGDPSMNSFNHYAYGAVGEWMYRYMLGIQYDIEHPGFAHVILQPQPDRRETLPTGQEPITSARGYHQSYYGDIRSAWQVADKDELTYDCTIPSNSTATLHLPVYDEKTPVYESGVIADEAEGVEYVGFENGCKIYRLGSGSYRFTTNLKTGITSAIQSAEKGNAPIFDLSGRILRTDNVSVEGLHQGVYISDGKKIFVK